MNILLINNYYYPQMGGGGETILKLHAEELAQLGHNPVVFSMDASKPAAS